MAENARDDFIYCAWNGGSFMIWAIALLAATHHPYAALVLLVAYLAFRSFVG